MAEHSEATEAESNWIVEILLGPCTEQYADDVLDATTAFLFEHKIDGTALVRRDDD